MKPLLSGSKAVLAAFVSPSARAPVPLASYSFISCSIIGDFRRAFPKCSFDGFESDLLFTWIASPLLEMFAIRFDELLKLGWPFQLIVDFNLVLLVKEEIILGRGIVLNYRFQMILEFAQVILQVGEMLLLVPGEVGNGDFGQPLQQTRAPG